MIYETTLPEIVQDTALLQQIYESGRIRDNSTFIGGELVIKADAIKMLSENKILITESDTNLETRVIVPHLTKNNFWTVTIFGHKRSAYSYNVSGISDIASAFTSSAEMFYSDSAESVIPYKEKNLSPVLMGEAVCEKVNNTLRNKQFEIFNNMSDRIHSDVLGIINTPGVTDDRPKNRYNFNYRETERVSHKLEKMYHIRTKIKEDAGFVDLDILHKYIKENYSGGYWYNSDAYKKAYNEMKQDNLFCHKMIVWMKRGGYLSCI